MISERRPNKNPVHPQRSSGYQPKGSPQIQSLDGRAGKLLGRAGAAHFRRHGGKQQGLAEATKSSKAIIFEGYRAKNREGKAPLKPGGSGKKSGKPQNRSSRRGAAYKASGKKKLKG